MAGRLQPCFGENLRKRPRIVRGRFLLPGERAEKRRHRHPRRRTSRGRLSAAPLAARIRSTVRAALVMWSAPRLFCAARILAETRRAGRKNRLHLDGCCKPMCKNGAAEAKLCAAEKQVTGNAKRAKASSPAPAARIKARRPPAPGGLYTREAQNRAAKRECILYSKNEYLIIFAPGLFPQGGACVSPVTKAAGRAPHKPSPRRAAVCGTMRGAQTRPAGRPALRAGAALACRRRAARGRRQCPAQKILSFMTENCTDFARVCHTFHTIVTKKLQSLHNFAAEIAICSVI